MANITLLRPPAVLPRSSFQSHEGGVPPLGMAYLAGSLRAIGHDVTIIDSSGEDLMSYTRILGTNLLAQGLSIPDIVSRIPKGTQVIGISCMFANDWIYTKILIKALKKRFPQVPLVAGGEYITADYKYILTHYHEINVCAIGEGEKSLLEIVDAYETGQPLNHVLGIAYLEDSKIVTTPRRPRIRKVDDIPWPSWDGIPLEEYFYRGLGNHVKGKRAIPMLASRGCPYRCTFCSSPEMWTTRWIPRNPDDIIREIKSYIDRYKIDHVQFYDLTAVINQSWIYHFCRKLNQENLGITWSLPNGTRTEVLTADVLRLLKQSGCEVMGLSPESGSEATLKRIKKRMNIENMLQVVRNCHKLGIVTKVNIIYGLPGQTLKECLQNMKLIARIAFAGADDVACLAFVPYPGSELFYNLKSQNKLPDRNCEEYELWLANNIFNDIAGFRSWSDHLSDKQLAAFVFGSMAFFYSISFLIRPYRLLFLTYRVYKQSPVTMLEMILCSIRNKFIKRRKLDVGTLRNHKNSVTH